MTSMRFVIQKHDASRLHYDFRLEMKNALASWAVPKGLNLTPNDRRLAIRTEDHKKDYIDFEGVIPEEEYGGGTVMVWDKGTYELVQDKDADEDRTLEDCLEEGSIKFDLKGSKLEGKYAMARTGGDGGKEKWIVFKLDDDTADARRNPVSTEPDSVKTGRSIKEIKSEEDAD